MKASEGITGASRLTAVTEVGIKDSSFISIISYYIHGPICVGFFCFLCPLSSLYINSAETHYYSAGVSVPVAS